MSLLNRKSVSPKALSAMTAFVIASLNAVVSLFLSPPWYFVIGFFAGSFCVGYFLYNYMLQRFIYRKIKLIYKIIYQTKATKREAFFYQSILPQKSIEEVSTDVQEWAEQKKKEIELLNANEQFRREFLMNLAHELRTPIFTVQGYIDTLLDGAIDDPEVKNRFLTQASKGIDRLASLVADMGEISKLEAGEIKLNLELFVIQDLIQDVFQELSRMADEKMILLLLKKGTERALVVKADKMRIRQVLVNLIENAIKYSSERTMVTAGCYLMDEKHVYVEISDDGPGMPEEHVGRVFERFYRVDRSRSSEVAGTGLGLAIVKHIIEAHGQTVNVRSKPGVGSSFGFTLAKGKE
ncbi:MAG: sensor histidine kinase [Bacteroidetes bacterium]|nr:sensor histidine kinase [Bacteroidota bacterium]MBS1740321.1 sensor histidine kinase [Bacteroidota bacterium]MBS1776858.1 sensor histidine kinase [Bacteroidota bacterium]